AERRVIEDESKRAADEEQRRVAPAVRQPEDEREHGEQRGGARQPAHLTPGHVRRRHRRREAGAIGRETTHACSARALCNISIRTVRLSAAVVTSRGNGIRTPCRRPSCVTRSRKPSRSTLVITTSSASTPPSTRAYVTSASAWSWVLWA